MEFNDKSPVYLQIADILKLRIIRGEYEAGQKLPSVRELAKEFRVNPNTIQNTYQELELEGLTYSKRGMGTFLTDLEDKMHDLKQEMIRDRLEEFLRDMENMGLKRQELIEMIKKGDGFDG